MKTGNVLLCAASGTFLMTLFSHILSGKDGKNFSEPKLLAALEKKALPAGAKELDLPAGVVTHYVIGVLFTYVYQYLCKRTSTQPTIANGLLFGALSGAAGILMWKAAFALHPAPPHTPRNKFYKQLFVAHLIFGITVALTEKAVNTTQSSES